MTNRTGVRESLLDGAVLVTAAVALALAGHHLWERMTIPSPPGSGGPDWVEDWQTYASEGRRIGPPDAPITIVEFGDYECPACQLFHRAIEIARDQFGDSIALVYRHFPLDIHPMGQTAARAAECAAEQGQFAPYHEMLYRNPAWRALGTRALESFATSAGVADSTAFADCLFSLSEMPTLARDRAAGIQLGVEVTPTVLVNGRWLKQLPDSALLVDAIRQALEGR